MEGRNGESDASWREDEEKLLQQEPNGVVQQLLGINVIQLCRFRWASPDDTDVEDYDGLVCIANDVGKFLFYRTCWDVAEGEPREADPEIVPLAYEVVGACSDTGGAQTREDLEEHVIRECADEFISVRTTLC